MNPDLLAIRADADPQTGLGHVMRCLALAQAWRDAGGEVVLLSTRLPPSLAERWATEGVRVVDVEPGLEATQKALASLDPAWVVLDGYGYGPEWHEGLRSAGTRVMVIDDNAHHPSYHVDLLLNQNPSDDADRYRGEAAPARALLGPRYALLRREFASGPVTAPADGPLRVLVTLGGADAPNATGKVLGALEHVDVPLRITLIAGPANSHITALREAAGRSRHDAHVLVDAPNMAREITAANLAIAAGGGTTWELARAGVPTILLSLADNQRSNCEWLHANGAAIDLGYATEASPGGIAEAVSRLAGDARQREALGDQARKLVDGQGAARTVHELREEPVRVRPATNEDAERLLRWANDPVVRAASFNSKPVEWEEHVAWLSRRLADPGCSLYIGIDRDDRPVGQIRFQQEGTEAEVHVSLAPEARSAGLGSGILRVGTRRVFRERSLSLVHAYVKPDNERSARAFERAGYKPADKVTRNGSDALHFIAYAP